MTLILQNPNKIKYVSIDPGKGRKDTIGTCTWDLQGVVLDMRQLTLPELDEFLDLLPPVGVLKLIIEEYIVNPRVPHGGSKVETARVIGQLAYWARKHQVEVQMQPSTVLPVAQKHSGVKIPKDHSVSHQISAYLHGYEYLLRQGIIRPRVLDN